mmetsp:Transcript_14813/g.20654  ORF Transcript_14813/g.20654 Transcript_14813/m.20654 type:complete len:218 (-) Transcript_14813:41-694(-)
MPQTPAPALPNPFIIVLNSPFQHKPTTFTMMSKLILLFALIAASYAVTLSGPCEAVTSYGPSFSVANYLGIWYEIARFDEPFEAGGCCDTANYTLQANGTVLVTNTENFGTPDGKEKVAYGQAVATPSDPSKLEVTFGTSPFPAPYWVVDTDYDSYALVWCCYDIAKVGHEEYAWILSRTPTMDNQLYNKLISEWISFGVPVQYFVPGIQDGCDHSS